MAKCVVCAAQNAAEDFKAHPNSAYVKEVAERTASRAAGNTNEKRICRFHGSVGCIGVARRSDARTKSEELAAQDTKAALAAAELVALEAANA